MIPGIYLSQKLQRSLNLVKRLTFLTVFSWISSGFFITRSNFLEEKIYFESLFGIIAAKKVATDAEFHWNTAFFNLSGSILFTVAWAYSC